MSNMIVSTTILDQLGGNRFIVMTGAKNFIGSDNALSFKIGKNNSKANCVRIELTVMDTYTITFRQVRKSLEIGFKLKEIKKVEGVYNDSLQEIFTEVTGLDTHL